MLPVQISSDFAIGYYAIAVHPRRLRPKTDTFLKKLLKKEKDSLLQHVLSHPETYRYQLVYTQIDRDEKNKPTFTNFYYQFDSLRYFNPASTVKLPLALLTLEKLHSLEKYGVNMNTPVKIDSSYSGQTHDVRRFDFRERTSIYGSFY